VVEYGTASLYAAPTAVQGARRFGEAWSNRHDFSGLRVQGTVGEPINPEA
jgi:acyl-coenzyme A synthetase/AMP-(fatty) acid ligase